MSIAQRTDKASKRPLGVSKAKKTVSKPPEKSKSEGLCAQDMDPFKFRIVERDGKYYFKDVRFQAPHVREHVSRLVVEYFEGSSLEDLSLDPLKDQLGELSVLPRLQAMLTELQQIFCE